MGVLTCQGVLGEDGSACFMRVRDPCFFGCSTSVKPVGGRDTLPAWRERKLGASVAVHEKLLVCKMQDIACSSRCLTIVYN
jgi:hypothetical protein